MLQLVESKKNSRLYVLDLALPQILARKLNLTDHLVFGAYNPANSQNTTLIRTVTHARYGFVIRDEKRPSSPLKTPNEALWAFPNSLYCHNPSYIFHSLTSRIMAVFAPTPFLLFLFLHTYIYIYDQRAQYKITENARRHISKQISLYY